MSDHVEWQGILSTIKATGAERIGVTHRYAAPLMRWLTEVKGLDAYEVPTRFTGESDPDSSDDAEKESERGE